MTVTCEFCGVTFTCNKSLKFHKNNAKKCLLIQGKNIDRFSCDFCSKSFSRRNMCENHSKICKHSVDATKKKFETLQSRIETLEKEVQVHFMLIRAQEMATSRGGWCLATEYKNVKTKMTWKCGQGHIWDAVYNNIQQGKWCPFCVGLVKKTLEDCQKLAESKDGKCLSNEYINARLPIEWECEFNHKWKAVYSSIQQGTWCPYCVGKAKNTLENCQKLAESKKGKCLSKEYISNTLLEWQCEFLHEWKALYGSIQQGSWCPYCAGNSRHTLEDCQKLAELRDGKCLSTEYINCMSPLEWQCKNLHIWKIPYNGIQQGRWCSECAILATRKTLEDCQKLAKLRGGKCLSTEYINAQSHLKWKCMFEHEWNACYSGVRKGRWCPYCPYKNEQETREIFEEILQVKFPKTRELFSNKSMELDGYSPFCGVNQDVKIGFEYQGRQHYTYVPHFHPNGPDDLDYQMDRDQTKRDECEALGIHLIEVPFDVKEKDIFIRYELIKILGTLPPHNYATIVFQYD